MTHRTNRIHELFHTKITYTVGHAGADYGSLGMMSGYNPKYKFGISLVSNSATSLNCKYSFFLDVAESACLSSSFCASMGRLSLFYHRGSV